MLLKNPGKLLGMVPLKLIFRPIMNVLYIDTRNNAQIVVRLEKGSEIFSEVSKANINKAQAALPLISSVLKKAKISAIDIDEIQIAEGSGSFTGLRVGSSIANALSFALSKKINQKKLGTLHIPKY